MGPFWGELQPPVLHGGKQRAFPLFFFNFFLPLWRALELVRLDTTGHELDGWKNRADLRGSQHWFCGERHGDDTRWECLCTHAHTHMNRPGDTVNKTALGALSCLPRLQTANTAFTATVIVIATELEVALF